VRIAFTEGEDVRQGDLLFVIDPRPFETALEAAKAAWDRDKAKATSAEAEARRYAGLVERGYVTKQQYDDARAGAEAAAATARADSAAVEAAGLDLAYCTIRAPISGRTGSVPVKQGSLIKANADEPLVVIQQMKPALVRFTVPERSLARIRNHSSEAPLRARAILPSDTTRAFEGVLSFFDNAVDPNTGTILLKASFPNEDAALWPGQFVDVFLDLEVRSGAVVAPPQAIQEGPQGSFVWVVGADSTAHPRPVVLGPRSGDVVVVEEGLQAGETVVVDGQLRLTKGAKTVAKSGLSAGGPAR
jgi:multidrug efflux system membrane fusion protein